MDMASNLNNTLYKKESGDQGVALEIGQSR